MLDQYLDQIQEGYFFSDKTISIDLDKFISGESNKLLIAGLSGGGKTTACRYLSGRYGALCIESDKCAMGNSSFLELLPKEENKFPTKQFFRKGYNLCVENHLKNNKREIVEGGLLWETYSFYQDVRPLINTLPVIIFGTSALKSSIRALTRKSDRYSYLKLRKLYRIYLRNFVFLSKLLKIFREERTKAGGNIQEFEIPKL